MENFIYFILSLFIELILFVLSIFVEVYISTFFNRDTLKKSKISYCINNLKKAAYLYQNINNNLDVLFAPYNKSQKDVKDIEIFEYPYKGVSRIISSLRSDYEKLFAIIWNVAPYIGLFKTQKLTAYDQFNDIFNKVSKIGKIITNLKYIFDPYDNFRDEYKSVYRKRDNSIIVTRKVIGLQASNINKLNDSMGNNDINIILEILSYNLNKKMNIYRITKMALKRIIENMHILNSDQRHLRHK